MACLKSGGPTIWFSTITEMISVAKEVPHSGNSTITSLARPSPTPACVMYAIQLMLASFNGFPEMIPPVKEPVKIAKPLTTKRVRAMGQAWARMSREMEAPVSVKKAM